MATGNIPFGVGYASGDGRGFSQGARNPRAMREINRFPAVPPLPPSELTACKFKILEKRFSAYWEIMSDQDHDLTEALLDGFTPDERAKPERKVQPGAEARVKAVFVPNQEGVGDAVEGRRAWIANARAMTREMWDRIDRGVRAWREPVKGKPQ